MDTELVRAALGQVRELFGALKPYEQRELMKLVLQRAEVNEREITLEVYALTTAALPEKVSAEGNVVRMRSEWLPGLVPQRALRDRFPIRLSSLASWARKESRARIALGLEETTTQWRRMLDEGIAKNRAYLARQMGVSRARVTKALAPITQGY